MGVAAKNFNSVVIVLPETLKQVGDKPCRLLGKSILGRGSRRHKYLEPEWDKMFKGILLLNGFTLR